jgi:hypothetical protein
MYVEPVQFNNSTNKASAEAKRFLDGMWYVCFVHTKYQKLTTYLMKITTERGIHAISLTAPGDFPKKNMLEQI